MKECTILLIITVFFETIAFDDSNEFLLNVGSVLFTPTDLKNQRFCKSKVALLRARRYLQSFIPPINFINTLNDEYIDRLIEYFAEGYASVKSVANDPETDRIMTLALSDVIGGYLKAWALPVTKFAFYGGTVSQSHAIRMFNFYDELRRYMSTDGEGWMLPNSNILNSIDINVAEPKHVSNTRSMSDPCGHLDYFAKTPSGLSVPIPHVNWDNQSNTMFIPLKNCSLIPLGSLNASSVLLKYYDAAKNCMQSCSKREQNNFDERFQNWLVKDVIPHLNDDRLYLAFESVLSLVNTSKDLHKTAHDIKNLLKTNNDKVDYCASEKPPGMTAKKLAIIIIILLLEACCCFPAVVHICTKKDNENRSHECMFVQPNQDNIRYNKEKLKKERHGKRKRLDKREMYEAPNIIEVNITAQHGGDDNVKNPKNSGHSDYTTNFSSVSKSSACTGVQSFYSTKVCSTEIASVTYDVSLNCIKPSFKTRAKNIAKTANAAEENPPYQKIPKQRSCTVNRSVDETNFGAIDKFESSKTFPLIRKCTNEKTDKHNIKTTTGHQDGLSKEEMELATTETLLCSCVGCYDEENMKYKKGTSSRQSYKSCKTIEKSQSILTFMNENEEMKRKLQYNKKQKKNVSKTNVTKANTGKPYLEIKLERPQQDVSADNRKTTKYGSPRKTYECSRPSKIPMRAPFTAKADTQTKKNTEKKNQTSSNLKHKSMIPQRKRQIYDDIVIKNIGILKEKKLNVSL